MSAQSVAHKIIKNTSYNIFGRFWGVIVSLLLTPYIIQHIGLERYGLWALVSVVTSYFGLLDFGLNTSFARFITEYYTKKDYEKVNQIVYVGVAFYSALAVLIGIASLVMIKPLLMAFRIPANLLPEAEFVFMAGIVIFSVSNALSPFAAVPSALQRFDITNKISIAVSIPNIIGTYLLLKHGYGLVGLVINNVAIFLLSGIASVGIAVKLLPQLSLRGISFSKQMLRKLVHFGWRIQVVKLSGVVTTQTDKILIVYFLSIGLVTMYQLGSSIVSYAIALSGLLVSALMPAFSEMEALGERRKLIEAYLMSTKYLAFLIAPVFIFLIASAGPLMRIWMGEGYEQAALIIQVLASAYVLNTIAQVASSICVAIDMPQLMAGGSIIIIVSNVILSIVCIKRFGFVGVAWGSMLSVNLGTAYFLIRLQHALKIPMRKLVYTIVPFVMMSLLPAAAVFILHSIVSNLGAGLSRGVSLMVLLIEGLAFICLYCVGVFAARLFSINDIDFLSGKLPFFGFLSKQLPYHQKES